MPGFLHPPLRMSIVVLTVLSCAAAAPGSSAPDPVWRDSATARLEALALLESLNADLLSHDSATLTLDRWCAAHHLADPATVTAERIHDVEKPPGAAQRELLHVGPTEAIGYRRVRLRCGSHILSVADNWYIPGRLTAAMNENLDHSDIAFGRAVQDLHFQRHTLSATLLWMPLPEHWDTNAAAIPPYSGPLQIPHFVLQHTAVLELADGTPISTVIESYTAEVLAFAQPEIGHHVR